jgi:hypothetical protein
VAGSLGLTPYSTGVKNRPAASARTAPRILALATINMARRSTNESTLPLLAPMAIRIPISRVRFETA